MDDATHSVRGVPSVVPPELLGTFEADYQESRRRDRTSRTDFGSGYAAMWRRLLRDRRLQTLVLDRRAS